MRQDDAYFKGPTDVTSAHRSSLLMVAGVFGIFFAIGVVLLANSYYENRPDFERFGVYLAIIPAGTVFLYFRFAWRKIVAVMSGSILRATSLEGTELVQREACVGKRQYVFEESRVPLDGRTVGYVDGPIVVFKQRGQEHDDMIGVFAHDFIDEDARQRFLSVAAEAGVEFHKGMPPLLSDPKPKRAMR